MRRAVRVAGLLLLVITLNLTAITPAGAIPALPSSFFGTVKVNHANLPNGTIIQALIDGQVYAEGYTQTYQGESVYALDIRADDSDTPAKDGGRDGDVIQFSIGGILSNETGIWRTATNAQLNLTASASKPIATPGATRTPLPTQTVIAVAKPALTVTNTAPESPTHAESTPTEIPSMQPSLTASPTQPVRPSPVQENETAPGTRNSIPVIFIIASGLAIIAGAAIPILRKKNRQ